MTSVLRADERSQRVEVVPALRERTIPDKIWVERGRLYYDWDFGATAGKQKKRIHFEGALGAFKNITDAAGVLKFARRYGPLFLCKHDKPYTHNPPSVSATGDSRRGCSPRNWNRLPAWEPIASWLEWAERTRQLLRAGADLHLGRVDDRDWEFLTGRPRDLVSVRGWEKAFGRRTGQEERVANARVLFSMRLNEWIQFGDVRPTFWWVNEKPDVGLAGNTLGMIAIQLAAEVSQAPAFAQCDGCGRAYFREGKRPQAGRRNFCPDCGRTAANRLGQRDFRRRQKGEK